MKTYILKHAVWNSTLFPEGTIVKLDEEDPCRFIATQGELKGCKGWVADGLNGWAIENTPKNRKRFEQFTKDRKKAQDALHRITKRWLTSPSASIPLKNKCEF